MALLALTTLVAALLLVFFLPRDKKFGYEYEQGRPWRYNSLIATFDFPIYKTQEEVQAERDSAMATFQPYYTRNEAMAQAQLAALRDDVRQGRLRDVPHACLMHVERELWRVYQAGIVPSDQLADMMRHSVTGIRLVEGREALARTLAAVYSTRSAYESIMLSDTLHYPRELMARVHINNYLEANLQRDTLKTKAAQDDVLASVSPAEGMVQSGQRIIDRGEIISAEQYKILKSYELETTRRSDPSSGMWLIIFGQVLFVLCVLLSLAVYITLFRRDYLHSPHTVMLLFSLVTLFPLITYFMVNHSLLNVYMVPYVMVPVFVRIFMDSRTAFMAMVCAVLLSSFPLHSNYEFILLQSLAGMAGICALRELSERSQLFWVALAIVTTTELLALAYDLAQGIDLLHIDPAIYVSLAISGVLLLFVYPLLYLIEKLFGFTSSVTLVEMSNTNNPLLRKMSKVAQGTFVHTMQVANLAAEVADKIGAKPQLARTGALYHDIGKMLNPTFFTENQTGVNPHDKLTEEESAALIISHVTEGLRLADKYHLPKVIRDFITTHHGRSKVKYFYIQWKNKHEGQEPDESIFTYPGPNPFTREQAILMMCDAVEATSRSLKEFSEENIKALVDRIVDGQVAEGYFRECPITFRDIADAKRVLVENLKTIYHTRIAYPELRTQPEPPQPRRPYFFGQPRR